jgi:homogentisate phytyltransferase/homogentisate geranylgeranyltransferase
MASAGAIALRNDAQPAVMAAGHLAALAVLCVWARAADARDQRAFTRFYMRVWALFFLEYLLVPAACLSG